LSLLLLALLGGAQAPQAVAALVPVIDARVIGGSVSDADYPRSAVRERRGGHTVVRLLATERGRVGECQITRSSGHADLDRRSCVIGQRFRYRPARDSAGRPTKQWMVFPLRWVPPQTIQLETPAPEGALTTPGGRISVGRTTD
jgi:TonB family protein